MEAMQKRILITLIIGAILIIAFYFITSTITKYTGFSVVEDEKESDFATCLKEQDITLYANTDNLAKTLREIKLFNYLQYFKIVNCKEYNNECVTNGIDFSNENVNWIINSQKINKDINLEELSESSGCVIIK